MTGRVRRAAVAGGLVLLSACSTPSSGDRAYLYGFERAERDTTSFAPATDVRPTLDLNGAYVIQRDLVARRVSRGDAVAGYKGGLMSQTSLRARGVDAPLVGVLFRSGRAASGSTISLCGYRKASFEMKLGFVFARALDAVPAEADALRAMVRSVVPVVDLPDIAYRDPDRYSAVDMVAANVSAARYVGGSEHTAATTDLDELLVAMTRDLRPITSGYGRESFDDQWVSLAMVARQILGSGRRIRAGDLVLTGKIGERGWLPAGAYRADYGPLGAVLFTVAACKGAPPASAG